MRVDVIARVLVVFLSWILLLTNLIPPCHGQSPSQYRGVLDWDKPAAVTTTTPHPTSPAQKWYVASWGSDSTNTGHKDSPFSTLKKALDSARVGDEIELWQGEFVGNGFCGLNLTKDVTITGQPYTTVVNCAGSSSGWNIHTRNSSITYIIIQRCVGNALRLMSGNLTLSHVELDQNAGVAGGAIFMAGNTTLYMTGCAFHQNSAVWGAACYASGGANITLFGSHQNHLKGNTASSHGGGFYMLGGNKLIIEGGAADFHGNGCMGDGGVIFLNGSSLVLGNNRCNNNVGNNGGAIAAVGGSFIDISSATFNGNRALTAGGAIYLDQSSAHVTHSDLQSNTCGFHGGALHITHGSYGGGSNYYGSNIAMGNGGGALVKFASMTTVRDTFKFNEAANGGGVYVESGSLTNSNFDVEENAASQNGGGVFSDKAGLKFTYASFFGNTAAIGGGVYCGESSLNFVDSRLGKNTPKNLACDGCTTAAHGQAPCTCEHC